METYQIQIILPDDVIEHLPEDSAKWVPYLANFFEGTVLKTYEASLQRRQSGSLGQKLSKYERAAYLDFLIDIALGQLRDHLEIKNQSRHEMASVL